LFDALRSIPCAWLVKEWRKSEREIKRIRNRHVHLSTKLWDEATYLVRRYRHQQQTKVERNDKAEVLAQQKQEGRQRVKDALAVIKAMGRIEQPSRLSTESDVSYVRVLSDYRRRVPRSLRNAQGGGLSLDTMCSVLAKEGVYPGESDDLDAFGDWLHNLTAKNSKGVKS
jgi:transcription initiation factor TFIID subunit TAF12